MALRLFSSLAIPTMLSRTPESRPWSVASPISWVPSRKVCLARSVLSRTPLTVKSLAFAPWARGPADWSRSSWSAAASWVACVVISVSSFMLSSCSIWSMFSLMRIPPSVVAATTGRASSDTRRVEMRQLRRAMREPESIAGVFLGGSVGVGAAGVPPRPARSAPPPDGVGPGFWACWGEELTAMGPVPPCGSGSAEALPSLLKRPCTSVATSGPGAPPRERRDGVGVVGAALKTSPDGRE